VVNRKRSLIVFTQQYLKMDPSNSFKLPSILPLLRSFQYYYNYNILLMKNDAFLWSLPTSTGFNLQHKNSIVILPFYINNLIRVVCQLSSVDISASTIWLTSRLISSEFKPMYLANFNENNYGIVVSCTNKESCISTMWFESFLQISLRVLHQK